MRTLLRHALTGQYYQSSGKWTTKPEQAHDFRFITRAMHFVRRTNCRNMEVGLQFEDPYEAASVCLRELLADA